MFIFLFVEVLVFLLVFLEESVLMLIEGKIVEEMIIILVMLYRYETVFKEIYIMVI